MLWSFCGKGGGVFFVAGGIGLFYQWQGIFFAWVLEIFFQWEGIFGVMVYVFLKV